MRHGGRPVTLGYLLVGTDPVSLDVFGLELLKEVEPRLEKKRYRDIHHLRQAVELGIGEPHYETIDL